MKKLKLLSLVLAMVLVLSFAFTACGGTGTTEADKYTYNAASADLPTSWNIHTYQANQATTVTGYTTDSLYVFDYNENKDGYKIVPSMAKDFPTDVTAEYVGKFGIEEGDENRVYKIPLRDDLKFDNGDPITAATFEESYKLLLNPKAANYRADSHFSGNLTIHGARSYALQGSLVMTSSLNKYTTWDEAKNDEDIVFDIISNNTYFNAWLAQNYGSYYNRGEPVDGKQTGWSWVLYGLGKLDNPDDAFKLQDKNWAEINADPALKAIWDKLIGWWQTDPNEELHFFGYYDAMPAYSWEDVGFFADGNNLVIVNDKELEGFYLKYSLASDFFLVHAPTYLKYATETEDSFSTQYGTSVETYVGFGPYKLTTYVADNTVKFEKNEYWWGYSDPVESKYYQTDCIVINEVTDEATRLEMFLQGKLDTYGLTKDDMADYQSSDYTYYTEGDSTWFVALNPDVAGLRAQQEKATPATAGNEVNKTILTVKEFRQALSFSLNRAQYAIALDPLGATAKALYGNMIVSDPDNGTAYRTTEEAKDVILEFWGLTDKVGEGKDFATKDEAIASITGYDLAGARTLFDTAYDIAVEEGLISAAAAESGKFEIQIVVGKPAEAKYYNDGYEFLKQTWEEAVKGTKLEGKLVFTQSEELGDSFSDYLKNNSVDVLFGVGWTGSVLDPYGLIEAYVAPKYQYDPGWDTSATFLDIEINGQVLRASVYAWGAEALAGVEIDANVVVDGEPTEETVTISAGANADMSLRLKILAAVEGAVLRQYDMIPVNLDSSANLKGMQIKYGTEEYIFGVGRGGVKYMTYTMSDSEWNSYVNEQGGTLNYK